MGPKPARRRRGRASPRQQGDPPFTARRSPTHDKLPILKTYLDKWAWEVGAFFELPKNPSDADIQQIAPQHPIFRIELADPKGEI